MAKLGIIICGTNYYVMERVDRWNAPHTLADSMTNKYYDYEYPVEVTDKQVGPQELAGWQD